MLHVVVGCPYTGMKNLVQAFEQLSFEDLDVINVDDINSIDQSNVYIGQNNRPLHLDEVSASFIRYPYDLIPPHSSSYSLRENTEFLKTVALAFDSVSINPIASTWRLRNRFFSLSQAEQRGVPIPAFSITRSSEFIDALPREEFAAKALGNCYFSPESNGEARQLGELLMEAKEGDESALIFPASRLGKRSGLLYLDSVGVVFVQSPIETLHEYRVYLIGGEIYCFEREQFDAFDKSAAAYSNCRFIPSDEVTHGLLALMESYDLRFLCFDLTVDDRGKESVIDINPLGSMPGFREYSAPSLGLARRIVEEAQHGNRG